MRSVLIALYVFAFSTALVAQPTWTDLNKLKPGQKIQLVEKNAKKHSGAFLALSETAITFTEGTSERSIQKLDVRSVKVQNKRRLRNTLIGAGLGAGTGAALGAATTPSDAFLFGKGYAAAFVGTAGAAVGATVGVLLPTHNTVYKAESH